MLVLSRKPSESVVIDSDIIVRVIEIRGDRVRLGIEAPRERKILRQEVTDRDQKGQEEDGVERPKLQKHC